MVNKVLKTVKIMLTRILRWMLRWMLERNQKNSAKRWQPELRGEEFEREVQAEGEHQLESEARKQVDEDGAN
jgi:hypothetical protein